MNKIVAFGEIMLRLAPANGGTIEACTSFDACYGGTEANMLACLSGLGHETSYLTALPENELGQAVLKHLHSFGVGTEHIVMKGNTLGTYFVQDGAGSRGASVIYNRAHSEITTLDEDAFIYDEVFGGARLFHISGISFALSQSSRRLAFRLIKEARSRNVTVSFDFNYRSKLWTVEKAGKVFREIVPLVDVVLASDRDLSAFLNTSERDYFNVYNNAYLILRNRRVLGKGEHAVAVNAYHGGKAYRFAEKVFPVEEKIGGGDAFNGALLHALLNDSDDLEHAVKFAVAAFALKHKIAGDTFTKSERDILNYAKELKIEL